MSGFSLSLTLGTWDDTFALVGKEIVRLTGPDEVTAADIRRRLEALAWDCPLHYDEAAAQAAGYRTIVAPATMLMTWVMPPYWKPGDSQPALDDPVLVPPLAGCIIPAPGTAIFATGNSTEYHEPVYPGDRITAVAVLTDVKRKRLSVGDGAFLPVETTYTKQTGEVVGVELMTFFRYIPVAEEAAESELEEVRA
jgi:acyl dehydratase